MAGGGTGVKTILAISTKSELATAERRATLEYAKPLNLKPRMGLALAEALRQIFSKRLENEPGSCPGVHASARGQPFDLRSSEFACW